MAAERTCSIAGCTRPLHATGMCGAHRERARKGQDLAPPIRERIRFEDSPWEVVESGCWEWQGTLSTSGYGRYKRDYAHRVSYERHVGPIPDGLHIDHLCMNTRCVNPEHLEPVTPLENVRRWSASVTRCKNGHEFTPENTYIRKDTGAKQCRACHRDRQRERQRYLKGAAA